MTENFNSQYNPNEEESTISIVDIWHMIWDYKWWYVFCAFVCVCVAALYLYRTPDTYQRTAKVIIDESDQYSAMKSVGNITSVMPGLRANNTVANEMEAIASPDLMQIVVERLGLETRYVESQMLRNVELYKNTPIELRLVDGNPRNSFSFTVTKHGNKLVLKDFKIGPDDVDGEAEGTLSQDIVTPAGTIRLLPTLKIEDFTRPIRVSWANSMSMAMLYC